MAQMQAKQTQDVQGQFTTAEVTHVQEALKMEGQCYIKNHVLMMLSGTEGPIREWHDNVTKANMDRLINCSKEMGIPLPFPNKLEDRENEIKSKMQGQNISGTITEGEALNEIKTAAMQLAQFYTTSLTLATSDAARDVFRRGFETVADNMPRVEQALKNTPNFFPPPMAKQVGLVNEGIQARK